MTEPVKMETMGGLTFNRNQVKSAKQLNGGTYEIVFKSGERLTYPEQKDFDSATYTSKKEIPEKDLNGCVSTVRNARVNVRVEKGIVYDDTYYDITSVMGATFTSSKDAVCHVSLKNSSDTTIDLSANDSKFYSDTIDATCHNGTGNSVILDKNDRITSDLLFKNQILVEGPGEHDL